MEQCRLLPGLPVRGSARKLTASSARSSGKVSLLRAQRTPGPGQEESFKTVRFSADQRDRRRKGMLAMPLNSPAPQVAKRCMTIPNSRLSGRARLMGPGRTWASSASHFAAPAGSAGRSSPAGPASHPLSRGATGVGVAEASGAGPWRDLQGLVDCEWVARYCRNARRAFAH